MYHNVKRLIIFTIITFIIINSVLFLSFNYIQGILSKKYFYCFGIVGNLLNCSIFFALLSFILNTRINELYNRYINRFKYVFPYKNNEKAYGFLELRIKNRKKLTLSELNTVTEVIKALYEFSSELIQAGHEKSSESEITIYPLKYGSVREIFGGDLRDLLFIGRTLRDAQINQHESQNVLNKTQILQNLKDLDIIDIDKDKINSFLQNNNINDAITKLLKVDFDTDIKIYNNEGKIVEQSISKSNINIEI